MSVTNSKCVFVALVIHHGKRMRRITLSSVTCLALPHFSTLPHIGHDFREIVTEYKVCVLIFSTFLSETFLILRRNERDMIKKCILAFLYSIRYFCQILRKLEFPQQIFEKYSNIKFHEIPSNGSRVAPCGPTDRRKDEQI
jgi:hypothetical protein